MSNPITPEEHLAGFSGWPRDARQVHLIEHGYTLDRLERGGAEDLDRIHADAHAGMHGTMIMPGAPDLDERAQQALTMAATLAARLSAGEWAQAYQAAYWLHDMANLIRSHVWAAHPEARDVIDPGAYLS